MISSIVGMPMELVRPPRRHEHAHHQQLLGVGEPRSAEPLVRAPG